MIGRNGNRPLRAILTYHSIDTSGSVISVAPNVFEAQVRWLSQSGVRVLSLPDLLAFDSADRSDAVSLTFDDGFRNFTGAAARLREHGMPATLFVVTGHVGGTNDWGGRSGPRIPRLPLLDWSELEQLVQHGVAIGAHTRTHVNLTKASMAAVEAEMDGCREDLRSRLGVEPSWFAYPYGAVTGRVAAAAARRFAGSVTTRFAAVTKEDRPMWLPRLDKYYFRELTSLDSWRSPGFDRKLQWVRVKRRLRETFSSWPVTQRSRRGPMLDSDKAVFQ